MKRVRAIGSVLLELFVEDARLTAALAIWIAILAAMRLWWGVTPRLAAFILFAGLAAILCENVMRAARRG